MTRIDDEGLKLLRRAYAAFNCHQNGPGKSGSLCDDISIYLTTVGREALDGSNQNEAAAKPRPDLDERATAVLRARTEAHGQAQDGKIATKELYHSFKTLGGVWRCLLEAAWPGVEIPVIKPWLVATLMSALKVWRMCKMTGEQFDDSCIDNINYTRIANKLRVWEEEQSAEKNGDSADEAMHPSST